MEESSQKTKLSRKFRKVSLVSPLRPVARTRNQMSVLESRKEQKLRIDHLEALTRIEEAVKKLCEPLGQSKY